MKAGLPFELLLGFRYLRSRGQRTNLSLFVWIGLGGVFLGVAALIVVLAVMTGFQDGIRGRIVAGMHEYDSSIAYLSLPLAKEFAGLAGVTGIEVKLNDPFDAKNVSRIVSAQLGFRYWVRDWMEMNRSLFAALQLEKLALFVVVTIIVLVAAFAIIGHLVLLVAEKRKEIGILKAVGASSRSITLVFFAVGMTIGVTGTAAGAAAGLILIWAQNTYKVIRLAGDVYQIDHLPMKLTPSDFLLVVGSTLVLSFLATLFPARRAGALIPVDVLRYE